MVHDDGMVGGDLVEVLDVEQPAVLDLGVVEEFALDPGSRRQGHGARPQLIDDAVDGDELDLEGVPDQHVVEKGLARGVVVAVGEARRDGHALGVEDLGPFAGQRANVSGRADGDETAVPDREGLGARRLRVDCKDVGVQDHEVRLAPICRPGGGGPDGSERAHAGQA